MPTRGALGPTLGTLMGLMTGADQNKTPSTLRDKIQPGLKAWRLRDTQSVWLLALRAQDQGSWKPWVLGPAQMG